MVKNTSRISADLVDACFKLATSVNEGFAQACANTLTPKGAENVVFKRCVKEQGSSNQSNIGAGTEPRNQLFASRQRGSLTKKLLTLFNPAHLFKLAHILLNYPATGELMAQLTAVDAARSHPPSQRGFLIRRRLAPHRLP